MALAWMFLRAGDVELLPVAREPGVGDLPFAGRQLLGLRRWIGDIERVEMHPAVALREEPHPVVVGQELYGGRSEAATRLAYPGVVMERVDHACLARLRIERD